MTVNFAIVSLVVHDTFVIATAARAVSQWTFDVQDQGTVQ